jgi:O-antigen/teichoic acid export membrane protein
MADDQTTPPKHSPPGFEVRYSPRLIRERRRNDLRAGWFSIFLAFVCFVIAFIAHRNHTWVDAGRMFQHVYVPPWLAVLLGLGLLCFGASAVWTNLKQNRVKPVA